MRAGSAASLRPALVAALVAVLAHGAAGPRAADAAGEAGRPSYSWVMAYASGGTGALTVVASNAPRARRLGSPASAAAISPDGRSVAFARTGTAAGLYVIPTSGGSARLLSAGGVSVLAWSPDGKTLAFGRRCDEPAGAHCRPGLYTLKLEGAVVRRVSGHAARAVAWSPDGHRLACACGAKQILLFDDERAAVRALTGRGDGAVGAPSWSPDGRLIAFGRHCTEGWSGPGGHDVYCEVTVAALDGSGKRTVLRRRGASGPSAAAPTWTAGDMLLVSLWGFRHEIDRVDLATHRVRRVRGEPGWLLTADTRHRFAYVTSPSSGSFDLVVAAEDGTVLARRRIPASIGYLALRLAAERNC